MHTSLQSLGECHCWWTRVSPRAHVAKFYYRLQLICSVLRASKFSVLKFIEIAIFLDLLHGIPLGFIFFWYFCDISFQLFKLLCLAKNHCWGFCTRNAQMVHIVNEIRFKMVYSSWSLLCFNNITQLVSVTAGRLQLIRSVSRASTFSVLKFIEIVIFWGLFTIPFGFSFSVLALLWYLFSTFFSYFIWLRITDDGSVLEMRIWFIFLSLFSHCKSQALHSIPCEVFANICPKHIFRFRRGGGGWVNFYQL